MYKKEIKRREKGRKRKEMRGTKFLVFFQQA
jgi:hypothetical protein